MTQPTLVALLLQAVAVTPRPETPQDGSRGAAARLLRSALFEVERSDTTAEAQLAGLLSAARAAGEELACSVLAAELSELVEHVRARASVEPDSARAHLEGQLRETAEDLEFEPLREADLPEGFPDPTLVREVERKELPAYRMARTRMGDAESAAAFWRLFRHIQRHEITMTAPVETTWAAAGDGLSETRMAFLYGSTALGTIGPEGVIEVVDVEPASVVSTGCRGDMTHAAVREATGRLRRFLEARGDLEIAGEVRTMGYNSPVVPVHQRFFEVQIPVRLVSAAERMETVIDFRTGGEAGRWTSVDDVVMGGRSSSAFTATGSGTCVFTGDVSLENGGGFASVRTTSRRELALEGAKELVLSFRGDGKRYKLHLRADGESEGVSYQAAFETEAGSWTERAFPLEEFEPVRRGRPVPDAPRLEPDRVRGVGFSISEGQAGEFRLEVASLSTR